MKQRRAVLCLLGMLLLFITAAGVAGTVEPMTGVATDSVVVNPPDPGPDVLPAPADPIPVACRMEPQCSTDADCFAWCGPTGGHCVHSSCPVRICKCR